MIELLLAIANMSGGILLGLATLDKWDGEHNLFNRIAGFLAPFDTIIGLGLIILAILEFWDGLLFNIVSILGGILLLTHVFGKVPALETSLRKLSAKLMPFKAIIGIGLIVIGLVQLF